MPILNFKPQFVEPIRSGQKKHTIRATRNFPVKRGDKLYLCTGLRRKGAFRILPEAVTCTLVQEIHISRVVMASIGWKGNLIFVDEVQLSVDECESLARADGFSDFATMMEFWKGRLPFDGQIIHWKG